MSSNNLSSEVVTVDEQAFEQTNADEQAGEPEDVPVVEETPEFRASVEQETQAKVDANHPEGIADTSQDRIPGATLEQEERIRAREVELERISAKAELGSQDGREERTRAVARQGSQDRRESFEKRAASVDPLADPERPDPREELGQDELGAVNKEAMRLAEELDGWSRAAIGRRLAEAVLNGTGLMGSVVRVAEELQTAPGHIVPIGELADINRDVDTDSEVVVPRWQVSVEGKLVDRWESDNPAIQEVGLIADESGQTKVTVWAASDQPWIREGERVRIHGAERSWHDGRVSLAVVQSSTITFPGRDAWWAE